MYGPLRKAIQRAGVVRFMTVAKDGDGYFAVTLLLQAGYKQMTENGSPHVHHFHKTSFGNLFVCLLA